MSSSAPTGTCLHEAVRLGHVYIVGDNRGTPMDHHRFGEVSLTVQLEA